jgi:hypothetical protein
MELASPVHFTKNVACHMQFSQQVDSKSEIKVNFITGMDRDTFGGILLCHLQRKVDALTSIQLLVIWGWNSYGLYSHAWLIEHESTLDWDENKLKSLYDVYNSQHNINFNRREWFLDDNTKLKTVCVLLHGGLKMNIIISEKKDILYPGKPLWIDPNR